jgi:hypothetical protein
MKIVKMTRNGQVTIPKKLRDQFPSQFFSCESRNGAIIFRPTKIRKRLKRRKNGRVIYQELTVDSL